MINPKIDVMITTSINATTLCEACHIEMEKKEPEARDLDINKLSLLAMFSVRPFIIVQCPACHQTGIHIH